MMGKNWGWSELEACIESPYGMGVVWEEELLRAFYSRTKSKSGEWNGEQEEEGDELNGKTERGSRKELGELSTMIFDDLTLFCCDEQLNS